MAQWKGWTDGRADEGRREMMLNDGLIFFGVPEEERAAFLEFQIQMSCRCVWV